MPAFKSDITINLLSIAMYVLQALGMYAIAKRRGIKNPWLAWIPIGSVWILGSISDDFRMKTTGRPHKQRIALVILTAVLLVMTVLTLSSSFATLAEVFNEQELTELFAMAAGNVDEMYSVSEEEFVENLSADLETRLTDEMLDNLLRGVLWMLLFSVVLCIVAVTEAVIECICLFHLYESCDPKNKLLYFLLGLFLGIQGLFIFLCRDKDAIAPNSLPGGIVPPPQEPWNE